MSVRILRGDVLAMLATLPDESVHCCVTSPPYYGLRDYGVPGQLGLEPTLAEYIEKMVAVFREVRRVLRSDGTLWLNIGDSYAANRGYQVPHGEIRGSDAARAAGDAGGRPMNAAALGFKVKDLMMVPERLALALQAPFFAGTIRSEIDRAWLASMIDGEGCIYIHKRGAGLHAGDGYMRKTDTYAPGLQVANCYESIVKRCREITGVGTINHSTREGQRKCFRWMVNSNEARQVLREVYPYLIGKQQQARIAFGCPNGGEKAEAAWSALKLLHKGRDSVVDDNPPPDCLEPGWYVRSRIIWNKKSCMPESVRDRPTKAHEHIWLLTKSERYYYDSEAASEVCEGVERDQPGMRRARSTEDQKSAPDAERNGMRPMKRSGNKERKPASARGVPVDTNGGTNGAVAGSIPWEGSTRNWRDVWSLGPEPFKDAHFATFPTEIPRRAIVAGCPVGGTVLDPFLGSGTTALVADRLQRNAIGIELNPAYADMAEKRIRGDSPLFAEVA